MSRTWDGLIQSTDGVISITADKIVDASGNQLLSNSENTLKFEANTIDFNNKSILNLSTTDIKSSNNANITADAEIDSILGSIATVNAKTVGLTANRLMKSSAGGNLIVSSINPTDVFLKTTSQDTTLSCNLNLGTGKKFQLVGSDLALTDLVGMSTLQGLVNANTAKTGISTTQRDNIIANNAKVGITTTQRDNIIANNAKVGITTTQRDNIIANNAKVGITTTQTNNIIANNAKLGITATQRDNIIANNAKVGITTTQRDNIIANNAKVGITTTQRDNIIANNAKVGITTTQTNNIIANNAKVGITSSQATTISNNESSISTNTNNINSNDTDILAITNTYFKKDGSISMTGAITTTKINIDDANHNIDVDSNGDLVYSVPSSDSHIFKINNSLIGTLGSGGFNLASSKKFSIDGTDLSDTQYDNTDFVDLTSNQTIAGIKTYSNNATFNSQIYLLNSKNIITFASGGSNETEYVSFKLGQPNVNSLTALYNSIPANSQKTIAYIQNTEETIFQGTLGVNVTGNNAHAILDKAGYLSLNTTNNTSKIQFDDDSTDDSSTSGFKLKNNSGNLDITTNCNLFSGKQYKIGGSQISSSNLSNDALLQKNNTDIVVFDNKHIYRAKSTFTGSTPLSGSEGWITIAIVPSVSNPLFGYANSTFSITDTNRRCFGQFTVAIMKASYTITVDTYVASKSGSSNTGIDKIRLRANGSYFDGSQRRGCLLQIFCENDNANYTIYEHAGGNYIETGFNLVTAIEDSSTQSNFTKISTNSTISVNPTDFETVDEVDLNDFSKDYTPDHGDSQYEADFMNRNGGNAYFKKRIVLESDEDYCDIYQLHSNTTNVNNGVFYRLSVLEGDTGLTWTNISYPSGYISGNNHPLQYCKRGDFVKIRGVMIKSSGNFPSSIVITTLTSVIRPNKQHFFNGFASLTSRLPYGGIIATDGTITIFADGASYIYLDTQYYVV